MFKVRRFRKFVMKYTIMYSEKPENVKQNSDFYIADLKNLIYSSNIQLEKAYSFLSKICNVEAYLSIKSMNIFWICVQKIVDWLYDKVLYSIEELDSCRISFLTFKFRAEQVKIFMTNKNPL